MGKEAFFGLMDVVCEDGLSRPGRFLLWGFPSAPLWELLWPWAVLPPQCWFLVAPGGCVTCLPPTVTSRLAVNGIFSEFSGDGISGGSGGNIPGGNISQLLHLHLGVLPRCWAVVARG